LDDGALQGDLLTGPVMRQRQRGKSGRRIGCARAPAIYIVGTTPSFSPERTAL